MNNVVILIVIVVLYVIGVTYLYYDRKRIEKEPISDDIYSYEARSEREASAIIAELLDRNCHVITVYKRNKEWTIVARHNGKDGE